MKGSHSQDAAQSSDEREVISTLTLPHLRSQGKSFSVFRQLHVSSSAIQSSQLTCIGNLAYELPVSPLVTNMSPRASIGIFYPPMMMPGLMAGTQQATISSGRTKPRSLPPLFPPYLSSGTMAMNHSRHSSKRPLSSSDEQMREQESNGKRARTAQSMQHQLLRSDFVEQESVPGIYGTKPIVTPASCMLERH